MEINGKEFDVKFVTRSQRKEIVKAGFRYKDKMSAFLEARNAFSDIKDGDEVDLSKIPLSEEEIDILIDVVFKDRLSELEQASFLECLMLASEIYIACLDSPAKN